MSQKLNPFTAFTRILLCVFIIAISNSCTKLNEVISPSLVSKVIGNYTGKTFRYGGQDAPLPIVSTNGDSFDLRFVINKGTAAETVNIDLITNVKRNGVKTEETDQYAGIVVEKGLDGEIILKENNVTRATVNGKRIELKFELDGVAGSFIGEKL